MLYLDRERVQGVRLLNQQQTREENIKRLYTLIGGSGVMTRAELVRITGLSPSTVSTLVDDLVCEGLVMETGRASVPSVVGRRPIMLQVCPSGRQIPVFSLSRWGVSYTLFDLQYSVLEHSFRPHLSDRYGGNSGWDAAEDRHDSGADYAEMMEGILANQARRFDRTRAVAILISYPGVFLEEEGDFLLTAMHTSFRKGVLDALEGRLKLPIFIGNSSMSLAYAEKKYMDAHGQAVDDLIYVNVCDGVGAGILCDGEIFMRSCRISGEIGHMTIQVGGRPCPCGNCGCLEQYVNVNAVIETVREMVAQERSGLYSDALRSLLSETTLEKIGRAYDEGIAHVCRALDDIAEKLFAGIYSIVSVTGIKCVIIGGGIERLGEGFLHKLRSFLEGRRGRVLMKGVTMTYPQVGAYEDSVGIAQYFIDKVFTITI